MQELALNKEFGGLITRLIRRENLDRDEANKAFEHILNDDVTAMHQGAFLAALTAKGETAHEVAGSWEAIYELDTNKVSLNGSNPVVENSGTGMDTFKTFNISTAASIIAASGGIRMARHGARAITSRCGTVDLAEALGVDVECHVDVVAKSIETAGLGLFNGMSPLIHPMALGRILSQISFGSTLNIAASLANPVMPDRAVRGVYAKEMILPVVEVMKAIGFKRALVLHGGINRSDKGMDEASVCGTTWCAELMENGDISQFQFLPGDFSLECHDPVDLAPEVDIINEPARFVALIRGREKGARYDAAILNAALIFYVAGKVDTIAAGIEAAAKALDGNGAFETLENWVSSQNSEPEQGLKKLDTLL
ncbi:anthranilate phosphoribosyltransferase [Desulfocicer vacuolatum]|nr:anthranilate phosphoribosyltransferase [Desulfocicer vacuolatum]